MIYEYNISCIYSFQVMESQISNTAQDSLRSLETDGDSPVMIPGPREDSGFFSGTNKQCLEHLEKEKGFLSKEIMELEENMECVEINEQTKIKSEACRSDFLKCILYIVESDLDGDTKIHIAVIQNHYHSAKQMVSMVSALDPELLDTPNLLLQTPLHLAVLVRNVELVELLAQHGADFGCRDLHGNTPLHIASYHGYDDIVACLLRYAGQRKSNSNFIPGINDRNYEGQTCLHLSTFNTNLPVIKLLTTHGADVNARDGKSGKTILHYAADTGNTILMDYILQLPGIDVNSRTYAGQTPTTLAKGRGYADIWITLRKFGGKDYENVEDT